MSVTSVLTHVSATSHAQAIAENRFRRHRTELRRIRGENSIMYATPLQMSFITEESAVQAVKDVRVHRMLQSNVKFACATRAIVYSNNICSLWIYVAGVVQE